MEAGCKFSARRPGIDANDFSFVRRRLERLFNYYDVHHVPLMFCPWDEFCARVPAGTTMAAAAQARMQAIFAAWQHCADQTPALCDTVYTLWVGFAMDVHMPLVQSANKPVHLLFRAGLTPEQTTQTLHVRGSLVQAIDKLWQPSAWQPQTALEKLIVKGKPNPQSVRYIRPQILRCGHCATSMPAVMHMLQRWRLGAYEHRTVVVPPAERVRIYSMSFAELSSAVVNLPSRTLYNIVAECIAACTVQSSAKHIRAAGVTPQFVQFAASACSYAESAMARAGVMHDKPRKPLPLPARTVCRWPLSAATCRAQQRAARRHLGFDCIYKFVCHHCTTVHIKSNRQPRAAKARVGVSFDIATPCKAQCNNCSRAVVRVPLTGYMTRAKVGRDWQTVTVCCGCAAVCTQHATIGDLPYCAACFAAKREVMVTNAPRCPCGAAKQASDRLTLMRDKHGATVVASVCSNHAQLVEHEPTTAWQAWADLFVALRTT